MRFTAVQLAAWKRRPQFEHFYSAVPCTYSMTVKLDVTSVLASKRKLYPTMLYAISSVVNRHEEFRTAFDQNGKLGIYDELVPCYTIFHKDTETFSNIWTPYCESIDQFAQAYQADIEKYGSAQGMNPKPNEPENTFPVSMIPWESFEGFNLNLQKGYDYLLPIFTIGKYCAENGRTIIPLAVQVHHAVCDGFHLCRFIGELRDLLLAF